MSVAKHRLSPRKMKTERQLRHLPEGNIVTNGTDRKLAGAHEKAQMRAARAKPDFPGKCAYCLLELL